MIIFKLLNIYFEIIFGKRLYIREIHLYVTCQKMSFTAHFVKRTLYKKEIFKRSEERRVGKECA